MAKRILFLVYLLALTAMGHAAPGVWEQMASSQVQPIRAVVKSVDFQGNDVFVQLETKEALRRERLCGWKDEDHNPQDSEEIQAVFLKAKIDILLEAKRSSKSIEYGMKDTWKNCIVLL